MLTLRNLATLGTCLIVVGLAGGCGAANPVAPDTSLDQATADDFVLQAVAAMDVVGGDVNGAISATPMAASAGAAFTDAAMWDTTFTGTNGLTYSASRTFYDASDNALAGWSPAAVRLHHTSTASGTIERALDTLTVGHSGDMSINGIQSGQDTLQVDGTCLDSLTHSFQSFDGTRSRYLFWTSALTLDAVRILKSTMQTNGRPFAGTVTFVVAADRLRSNNRGDVEAHFDATIVIVFHDGAPADITVGGTHHYFWNTQTGFIARTGES